MTQAKPISWMLPLLIVAFSAALISIWFPWSASIQEGPSGYQIDRPRSPLWRAPVKPSRQEVERSLPVSPEKDSLQIEVQPDIARGLSEWVFVVAALCLLCTPFYMALVVSINGRNTPLRMCTFAGLGAVIGACICVLIWMVVGGWGPAGLSLFIACGLLVGAIAAFAKPAAKNA